MIAKTVYHQGKVKIHYQHKTRAKRISTGVSISKSTDISSDGKLKSFVPNMKEGQIKINTFKKEAQELVDNYFIKYKDYPTGKEFDKLWSKKADLLIRSENLIEYYERYLIWKSKDSNVKKASSMKDYNSLKKNLQDYQSYLQSDIMLGDINQEWLAEFAAYLRENKGDDSYTSKCNHKPSTIKKRTGTMKSFFKWLEKERLFDMPRTMSDFMISRDKTEPIKGVLTKEEVKLLYEYSFQDEKLIFIRDVFIFSCLTGMRFSDLITLRKSHIKTLKPAGPSIIKKAVKTGHEFRVPLNKTALDIFEKHSYNLGLLSNANFNKYLHILLHQTEMFEDTNDFDGVEIPRWKAISIHNARDTFITLLIQERVALNEIMKYTGHKSVDNLNKYIDTKGQLINYVDLLI